VYGIAGSKDQAGIARDFAKTWAAEPPLSSWLSAGSTIRCPEHKGSYRVLSSDGRLGQGVNPSAGIVDEWWLFHHQRERETYNAIAKALHKRSGSSWLLAITTAGWDKHSQLGETYERAIGHPKLELRNDGFLRALRDTKSGFLMHWYGVSDDGDRLDIENPALIRACNPARWVRPADLIAELNRPDCDEYDWRRLHLNQWTAARDAWLPASTWQRLHTDQQIPAGAEVYLGIDIGLRHDSTAVAIAHRLEDGRTLLNVHVWATDPDTAAHTHLERIRLAQIEDHIRELARRYRVREVAYDPHFFQRSAELLEQAGITMVEFLQASGPMADAYQGFYQDALEGRLCHNADPVLQAHIDATAATRTERGWKIHKLEASERIDATVACVLACARARHHQPRQAPTVYWMEA
jgi:phage terminase large subunit-like protein